MWGENLVQPLESVTVALEPADTFLDGQAGFYRVGQWGQAGQGRQIAAGFGCVHKRFGFAPRLAPAGWGSRGFFGALFTT